ncbi:hypothetical protein D3C72_1244800 [compost metagenome]
MAAIKLRTVDLAADEVTHQFLGLGLVAAGVGHANGKVALPGMTTEQQLPGTEHDHERGQAVSLAEGIEAAQQGRRQVRGEAASDRHPVFGARAVYGQVERNNLLAQVLAPVAGSLGMLRCSGVVLALPTGIVGVLDGRAR